MKFQAIKGVRDILPPESALWNRVERTAREVFGTFGFAEIRLPMFEQKTLFARSIGLDTDVVSKEMYNLEDHIRGALEFSCSYAISATKLDSSLTGIPGLVTALNNFLSLANTQIRNGDLPRTSTNDSALAKLEQDLNFFAGVSDSPLQSEIMNRAGDTKDTLEGFETGS